MHTQDSGPGCPAYNGILALVARVVENAQEHETGRNGGVKNTEEDDGRNHEGKGDLLVYRLQRSESGTRHVLVSGVCVDSASNNAEDNDLEDGASPQGLGEVSGLLHFGNETGQSDLADEGIADVKESVEAVDESCRSQREHGYDRRAVWQGFARQGVGCRDWAVPGRVALDTGENDSQDDGDEGENCRSGS